MTNPDTICGCDWSGFVVKTGKDVDAVSVGDHVAGFVQGGTYQDRGAFVPFVDVRVSEQDGQEGYEETTMAD